MYNSTGVLLLTLLTLVSCNKTNDSAVVLARVGNSVLTRDDVMNRAHEHQQDKATQR